MEGAPPARGAHLAWARVVAKVFIHPELWLTALRQCHVLAAPDWRRFRLETQYGDSQRAPDPDDVVAWLAWCRSWRRTVPTPHGGLSGRHRAQAHG